MRYRNVLGRAQGRYAFLAVVGAWLFAAVAPAAAQIAVPVPFQLSNGQVIDAAQLMANYNSIINNVNANAAKSGVNSDISSLIGVGTITASGPITTSGAITGASFSSAGAGAFGSVATGAITAASLTASGNVSVTGTLNVAGTTTLVTTNLTGTLTVLGAENVSGGLGVGGALGAVGNVLASSSILVGGASLDTVYSASTIVLPYGSGIRANNIVSARGTLSNGFFGSTFNLASTTHPSTGVYTFTFAQPMQSTAYQVHAGASQNGSSIPIVPIVVTKTTTGFTLNYNLASTGALTDVTAVVSDIMVSGGN